MLLMYKEEIIVYHQTPAPSGMDIIPHNPPPRVCVCVGGYFSSCEGYRPSGSWAPILNNYKSNCQLIPHLFPVPLLINPQTDLNCKFSALLIVILRIKLAGRQAVCSETLISPLLCVRFITFSCQDYQQIFENTPGFIGSNSKIQG